MTHLCLTDNAIGDNLGPLTRLSGLQDLDLSGNRISTATALTPLTALSNLISLDISGCPLEASDPEITSKLFTMLAVLPAFKYINGEDRLGNGRRFSV